MNKKLARGLVGVTDAKLKFKLHGRRVSCQRVQVRVRVIMRGLGRMDKDRASKRRKIPKPDDLLVAWR